MNDWDEANPDHDELISDDNCNRAWETADWQAMITAAQEKE